MLTEYYGIFYIVILAVLFAGVTVFLSSILGPKRRSKVKSEPFECGIPTEGAQYVETPVKFYIIALLFLFFEITVVGGVPLMTELVPKARSPGVRVVAAAMIGIEHPQRAEIMYGGMCEFEITANFFGNYLMQ